MNNSATIAAVMENNPNAVKKAIKAQKKALRKFKSIKKARNQEAKNLQQALLANAKATAGEDEVTKMLREMNEFRNGYTGGRRKTHRRRKTHKRRKTHRRS